MIPISLSERPIGTIGQSWISSSCSNHQHPSKSHSIKHKKHTQRLLVSSIVFSTCASILIQSCSLHLVQSLKSIPTVSTRRSISVPRYNDLYHIRPVSVTQRQLLHMFLQSTTENDTENDESLSETAAAMTNLENTTTKVTTTTSDTTMDRTSFDEAGRSLTDEQDMKRMNEMGDFDANPNSSPDQMDQMRAAIRARTASMGIEKSKVSADYIAQRQQDAMSAGSAKAAAEASSGGNMFGGLDLSQISTEKVPSKAATKNGLWLDNEDEMPSMFYDPEDELSLEERAEVDPIGQKSFIEQGLNELQNAKWPTPVAALREVALMIVIIALTGALIIGWDKLIRTLYTDVLHFIPSKQDLLNYMNRFDGLELPSGWTDNMNDDDVASFSEKITNAIPGSSSGNNNLPEL